MRTEIAVMAALTTIRFIAGIGAPIALLIAAIAWPGPRHPWPLEPTLLALAFVGAYLAASAAFFLIANRTTKEHQP